MTTALLDALRGALGPSQVLCDGDLSAWELDWRKRWRGKALAVVRPGSTDEVAAVVQLCRAHGTAIVPQGGNTGLVGGSTPDGSGQQLVLSLSRLNRVRSIDEANLTMTVEAGCVLQAVQEAAAARGLLFPLSLAAEGSCTIGGNLATNGGRHPGVAIRLGARPSAWAWRWSPPRARSGTLDRPAQGQHRLRPAAPLHRQRRHARRDHRGDAQALPRPAAVTTAWAAVPSVEAAVALLQRAQAGLGAGLTGFELMGDFALSLVRRHFPTLPQPLPPSPWTVLLEQSTPKTKPMRAACSSTCLKARWKPA